MYTIVKYHICIKMKMYRLTISIFTFELVIKHVLEVIEIRIVHTYYKLYF